MWTTLLQPNGRNSRLPYARPNSWSPQGSGLARGWQPTAHCRKALLGATYILYSVKIATRGEDIRMGRSPEPDGEGWGRLPAPNTKTEWPLDSVERRHRKWLVPSRLRPPTWHCGGRMFWSLQRSKQALLIFHKTLGWLIHALRQRPSLGRNVCYLIRYSKQEHAGPGFQPDQGLGWAERDTSCFDFNRVKEFY